ncbi:hypothetical protein R3P38DRAFT_2848892 [Favolaschia claudopus]|uniref:Uncharacterized protein n=1 Tax=Favolaschia claudopus TaxID=2862362 RepID=A0AAW0DUU4_9AGAR
MSTTKFQALAATHDHDTSFSSQGKPPTTSLSRPHPLLKSSRGRVLWPDQRQPSSSSSDATISGVPIDDDSIFTPARQRTSSITSIETIRLRVKSKVAEIVKPKPPLKEIVTTNRPGVRKRTHSATSPEADDADSPASRQTGPRVRQRKDSGSSYSATSGQSGLKKLKDKLSPTIPSSSSPRLEIAMPQTVASLSKDVSSEKEYTRSSDLPLQSISTNTQSKRPPLRRPISGARLNKYGCYEPHATEFELAVIFPSTFKSNFEVWDQEDELFLIGPLTLHLTLKDPAKWDGVPISHPDVFVVDLSCTSKPIVDPSYPYCSASAAQNNKYSVRYDGAKIRCPMGKDLTPDPRKGISVDTLWFRTFADGGESSSSAEKGNFFSSPSSPGAKNPRDKSNNLNPIPLAAPGRRGWAMQFFIPIATRLFEKCETRAFRIEGLVSVWNENVALKEPATMSVSHLMREREMVRK